MGSRLGWQLPATVLALAVLAAALLLAPVGDTAPGDIADLEVTKADSPDPVLVGAPLTYAIRVANLGPQGATSVSVTDSLPPRTEFVSATTTSGSCERKGRRVTCSLGALAADPIKANAVTVTIQVRPRRVETIVNSVSVDSVENDPVPTNNTAEESTTVTEMIRTSSCRGVTATITGTPRGDQLVGTGANDVIAGLAGNDRIFGFSGRDLICGGSGGDTITAGSAADRVFGGRGGDRLRGRGGPDLLAGNPGRDDLGGGGGADRLRGGSGSDRCNGGPGLDRQRGCER
jgi:uncharacterized repeat protein (TIGR01451 family)